MSNDSKMPPTEELRKIYGPILDNPGFRSAHDRSDPSFGTVDDDYDDERVLAQVDDEGDFIQGLKSAIRRRTGL